MKFIIKEIEGSGRSRMMAETVLETVAEGPDTPVRRPILCKQEGPKALEQGLEVLRATLRVYLSIYGSRIGVAAGEVM